MKLHTLRMALGIAAVVAASTLASARASPLDEPSFALARGRGAGGWCAPSPTMPGQAAGVLYDSAGVDRFDVRMSFMLPFLTDRGMLFGEIVPIAGRWPPSVPHMYLSGWWVDSGDDKGRFQALVLSDLGDHGDLPLLGMVNGEFDLTPNERSVAAFDRKRARPYAPVAWARPAGDGGLVAALLQRARMYRPSAVRPADCYKGPDPVQIKGKQPAGPANANELHRGIFTATWWLQR